ncbi:MAG: hypothetical protein GF355_04705, partial [Candidatus Eisenbacteria bacterium]|nr:hypothetical protein [Candidatus Eisenbacteria bacterium]
MKRERPDTNRQGTTGDPGEPSSAPTGKRSNAEAAERSSAGDGERPGAHDAERSNGHSADRGYIEQAFAPHPDLKDRLLRALLIALHSRGVVSINEIHRQARAGRPPQTDPEAGDNVQLARRWD